MGKSEAGSIRFVVILALVRSGFYQDRPSSSISRTLAVLAVEYGIDEAIVSECGNRWLDG